MNRFRTVLRTLLALLIVITLSGGEAAVPPPLVTPSGTVANAPTTTVGGKDATLKAPGQAKFNAGGLVVSIDQPQGTGGWSTAVSIMLLITVLAVAPSFLMMVTSFTCIIIVLGFLRRALGTQTLPPNQVMVGLALFLTLFVMAPTLDRINREAVQPFMSEQITQQVALDNAKAAVKDFMVKHTRKNDLALFIKLAKEERFQSAADVTFTTLVPAFITSELKTAFQMGFIIFLPFLVIDLVISAVLMALGMMMLPPVVVSLPFKILVFVLVDGWVLLMQGLVASYA
ncbi:MAG TPA: flagellar type III secretion system pore protein FliP [Planctomycetota bacterium]|nr:flagellar type III secretion system pore protein FliP [Planctomycetota bacterium]